MLYNMYGAYRLVMTVVHLVFSWEKIVHHCTRMMLKRLMMMYKLRVSILKYPDIF